MVTKPPMQITVCGDTFHIVRQEALKVDGDTAYGFVDFETQDIQLARTCDDKPISRTELFDTLVHEIVHIVIANLPRKRMTEEAKATFIGREVAKAICRNRATISYILKG